MGGTLAVAGIRMSDLEFISLRTLGAMVVVTALGTFVVRRLAGRSVGVLVMIVVIVSVICSMAGIGIIAIRMLSGVNQDVVLDLMAIAGLSAFIVALLVGRQISRASRALLAAVRGVGDNGEYVAPAGTLPSELAELSDGFAAAHEKLSHSRERERALEASRRELVAWVSHDLRTPLAGLRAMAEALEDQVVVDPRTVSAYHTQIRREVDRLTVMIDDLFALSRIHAGALRLVKRPVELGELIGEALTSAEPLARAKGVQLRGFAVASPPVLVDAAEVGRALRNLLTN